MGHKLFKRKQQSGVLTSKQRPCLKFTQEEWDSSAIERMNEKWTKNFVVKVRDS